MLQSSQTVSLTCGINPPVPSNSNHILSKEGSRLLALIRLLEKNEYSPRNIAARRECLEILERLIAACARQGLLGGNPQLAEQVLGSVSSRKHQRGRGVEEPSTVGTTTLDVILILQAVVRILSTPSNSASVSSHWIEDSCLLLVLAADFCTVTSEFLQSRSLSNISNDRCLQAEYELLANHTLLASLAGTLKYLWAKMNPSPNRLVVIDDSQDELTAALISCLRAASSLIRLFGTRLSRMAPTLDTLNAIGWQALAVTDDRVQLAAAILLSTLPLTRNFSESWQHTWLEATATLHDSIHIVAPIVDRLPLLPGSSSDNSTIRLWLQAIAGNVSSNTVPACDESSRVESFLHLLAGLTRIIRCLFGDFHPSLPSTLVVQLNVACVLDLIELMISFASSSEAVYFGTKKRLRAEAVDNGAVSPTTLVTIANSVKLHGLEILTCVLETVGGATLLPYSYRIQKIASLAVGTCCSTSMRKAMDSTTNVVTKNPRWLHTSIALRTAAIRAFQQCVLAFGTNIYLSSGPSSSNMSNQSAAPSFSNDVVDRTITLIGGTLVEQLLDANLPELSSGDWGSFGERSYLVEACASCLSACLCSGGELIVEPTRLLIDSVIHTCLKSLIEENGNPLSRPASLRVAFLTLGAAGATTCFRDGSASPVANSLERAARSCQGDRDSDVAMAAASALSVCAALSTSRVPALFVVTAGGKNSEQPDAYASRILSPVTLLERLEAARVEVYEQAVMVSKSTENNKRSKVEHSSTAPATESTFVSSVEKVSLCESDTQKSVQFNKEAVSGVCKGENVTELHVGAFTEGDDATAAEKQAPVKNKRLDGTYPKLDVPRTSRQVDDLDEDIPMIVVDAEPDEEDVT